MIDVIRIILCISTHWYTVVFIKIWRARFTIATLHGLFSIEVTVVWSQIEILAFIIFMGFLANILKKDYFTAFSFYSPLNVCYLTIMSCYVSLNPCNKKVIFKLTIALFQRWTIWIFLITLVQFYVNWSPNFCTIFHPFW